MDMASVAIRSLLPKLVELLGEQYKLHKGVKEDIQFLSRELRSMHAALRKVAEVPRDRLELDDDVNLWANQVRNLSYNLEDVVDTFLVRIEPTENLNCISWLVDTVGSWLPKYIARHQIAQAIKVIKVQLEVVAAQRDSTYRVADGVVASSASARPTTLVPRLRALYMEAAELVGIHGQRDRELLKLLCEGDDAPFEEKLKIVSIVGIGGLGKTTLAKAVYNQIQGSFHCKAFVPVGRNADAKKILMDILLHLGKPGLSLTMLDERQLIDKLRDFFTNKRYLIVIDDIWDEKLWGVIKLAFSGSNNLGSRLITTTRIVSVSKACCLSSDDSVFQMKPLNDEDSQRLFYKRIFPQDSRCPPEFDHVSKDILKRCGGVPLAITTIAGILANGQQIKPEGEWHVLLNSIGCGLTEDASMDEMQIILSFGYHDLPSHLKSCLLYLSMFPENHEIKRDRLIWMWIAEGLFPCEKQETSLFELGETYFNELISRNMIQPVYNYIGKVQSCRVHDMVHDLICSLSSEENFAILHGRTEEIKSSHTDVRRLSFQYIKEDHQGTPHAYMSESQVRSIIIFPHAINQNKTPSFVSFNILRVLDMSGCYLGEGRGHPNLRHIGSLLHLRYLSLAGTNIDTLPTEIGRLRFLQVLNIRHNSLLRELPSTTFTLRRLMRLHIDISCTGLPDGLGNLTSMEVLDKIKACINIVKEMHKLTRLRELSIDFYISPLELEEAFIECIRNMHNIRSLTIHGYFRSMDLLGERWVPPRHLRVFHMYCLHGEFSALPTWIKVNPWLLSNLCELAITVADLKQEDLGIIGNLPALCRLQIESTRQTQSLLVIGSDGFRSMISLSLICRSPGQIVFESGALVRVEHVALDFCSRMAKDVGNGNGDFDLGLGNLPSLRFAHIRFFYGDRLSYLEVKKFHEAVENTEKHHHNHRKVHCEIKFRPKRAPPLLRRGIHRARPLHRVDTRTMEDMH